MNRIFIGSFALSMAAMLAACAQPPTTATPTAAGAAASTNAVQQAVAKVQTITVADLKAADADALAQTPPDTIADQCYSKALIPLVQAGGILPNPGKPVGLVSTFQAARDIAKAGLSLANGLTPAQHALVVVNCGPLALDSVTDINSVLAKVGIGAINSSVLGGL